MRTSTSSLQTSKWCTSEFDSHATTKYNNMSKIRDNYLAELIIILVIATMLLSSCQQETECMYANQTENIDEVD